MRGRLLASAALLGVGALAWLPLSSVALCAALRTLRQTDPWAVPLAAYTYWHDYGDNPAVAHWLPLCAMAAAALLAVPPLTVLCIPASRRLLPARPGMPVSPPLRAASDAHGSADWLDAPAMRKLFPGPHPAYGGVVIGEAYRVDLDPKARGMFDKDDRRTWGQGGKASLLIDPCTSDSTHGTLIAGSGGYKTTAVTIPTLATWTGSAVVFDPPGQVGPMTTPMREAMGHRVWSICPGGHAIDVLGWINPADAMAETDVLAVLDWIGGPLDDKSKGENAIFAQGGRKLLACLLADMLWDDKLPRSAKTLREFRARITTPEKRMKGRLQEISEGSQSAMARDYARSLMDTYVETFSGVYFNATAETDFLAIAAYAEMLSRPDFDPSDICNGATTVFIAVPMKDLKAVPALGRVLVATFQAALRRAAGQVKKERVLFLLDEARFLGQLSILADMMTADRKYGATVITMWQSETDQKAIWKDQAGVFSANSSWTMYAAVDERPTAETVSHLAGKYTILARTESQSSGSQSGSNSGSRSRGLNQGRSEQARELIKPDEVRTMRTDEAIIFRRGAAPIRCGRAIFFRRSEMLAQVEADRLRLAAE